MANAVFKRDVLRIHLSDLDQTFREHTLGVWEGFCMVGMFDIITSVEHGRGTDFSHDEKVGIFMIGGCRQGPMDRSESNFAALTRNGPRHDSQSLPAPLRAAQLVE